VDDVDDEVWFSGLAVGEEYEPYDQVTNFEDLRAWQYARALTTLVYQLTRKPPLSQDRSLCDQMQRASVSIMANIAEGYERESTKEYHRFLSIAKASCAELRSHAYVVFDAGYIDQVTYDRLMPRIVSVNQLTGALRASIALKLTVQK